MKICIDDGSTNIKLAWTENGERRNAISPNSFKSEWSAPFGGTQPANYMLDACAMVLIRSAIALSRRPTRNTSTAM